MDATGSLLPYLCIICRCCLQIASKDKDFRYMATSDLQGELAKDNFRTDGETEKKLCHVILQQLDDISGDISGLAVKWCVVCTAECPGRVSQYCVLKCLILYAVWACLSTRSQTSGSRI